jgi:flagellar protein FliJ
MRFVYQFQALLNWKKNLEELSQLRLADLLKNLKAQEEEIQRLKERRSAYDREIKEKSAKGLRAGEALTYQQYFDASYQDLLLREGRKQVTLREIGLEREKLIHLTKQRKILEKLQEKRFKKFVYQVEQAEQKNNDERALWQYQPPT